MNLYVEEEFLSGMKGSKRAEKTLKMTVDLIGQFL